MEGAFRLRRVSYDCGIALPSPTDSRISHDSCSVPDTPAFVVGKTRKVMLSIEEQHSPHTTMKNFLECNALPQRQQESLDFSCTYEKPQLQELAVPSNVVCGGSNYDLGDKRNFDGAEEETVE